METSNTFSSLADEENDYNEGQNFYVQSKKASDCEKSHNEPPHGVFESGCYRRVSRGRGGISRFARGSSQYTRGMAQGIREPVRHLETFSQQVEARPRDSRASAAQSRNAGRGRFASSAGRSQPRFDGHENVFGESTKAPRTAFPRVVPMNVPTNTEREDQRMRNQAIGDTINYLREAPDEDCHASLKGVFLWPSDTFGIEPMRTEDPRLDEIRRRYCCHVVLAHNPLRLCIYGSDKIEEDGDDLTSSVLQAIRNLLQEISQRSSQCMRFILAQPPAGYGSHPIIRMVAPSSNGIISQHAAGLPKQEGKIPLAEPSLAEYDDNWHAYARQQIVRNTFTLQMALAKTLDRLIVSPVRVEIKAILGSFVFRRIASSRDSDQSGITLDAFMGKLRSTKCEGGLFRLSPKADVFGRVLAKEDILTAYHIGKQCSLLAVKPTFVGVFTFPPHDGDVVDRQLSVEATGTSGSSDAPMSLRRTWTSPVDRAMSRRLEAFVTSLDGGVSWKLEAVAHPFCRNIGDELQRFQSKVTCVSRNVASSTPGATELMFEFPRGEAYRLKDFYQRTQWKFFSKVNRHYVLQVSRLDRFEEKEQSSKEYGSRNQRHPTQTQWEACVFDDRWEELLGQNAALNIGESAGWEKTIAQFFPSQSSGVDGQSAGFASFVDCVTTLCQGISEAESW